MFKVKYVWNGYETAISKKMVDQFNANLIWYDGPNFG